MTYGIVLLLWVIAYFILQTKIIKSQGEDFPLRKVVASKKGKQLCG